MITLLDQAIDHIFKLFQNDHRDKALETALALLEQNPEHARVVHTVAMLYLNMDRTTEALPYLLRSIELDDKNPVFLCNLGAYYTRIGEHEKSLEVLKKAIDLKPDYTDAMLNMGHVMSMLSRFDEAIEWASKAHAIVPEDEQLSMNLYTYLRDQDFKRGFAFLQEMRLKYDRPHFWRVSCSDALYLDDMPEEEIDALHFELGRKVAGSIPATRRYLTKADPERKIRVGFMSSDLRKHSVSYFLHNWVKLMDPNRFELYFYLVMGAPDDLTKDYENFGTVRVVHMAKVQSVVNVIYNDAVDILFELNGLTIGGRPDVLAVKPAPVIVSAIGYAHSIGLDRVDYRLCDAITDPDGAEVHHAEKLARIEGCFLSYGSFDPLPEIEPVPERPVTFGSFNNHLKINATTVKLWSNVLKAVPGSVLVLKALGLKHPPIQAAVTGWFEKEGVADRIRIMEPQESVGDHQQQYREMDISLDTFPYNGTTTTMESLLMGVPVVTLMGDAHRKRVGGSLLRNAGLGDWVAEDETQFVEIAKGLADRVQEVRAGRQALREKVSASPVMDSQSYVKKMEAFLDRAWRDYCASKGA